MSKEFTIDKILLNIEINENGCWIWKRAKSRSGYGKITINYKSWRVHRFMYEYYYGQLCPDLTIDHLCRNRLCCNPIHLEQVSQKENNIRGNTITSINAKKTHCQQGHLLAGKNLHVRSNGSRLCKKCDKEHKKRFIENNPTYWKDYWQKTLLKKELI